jgi:hypothetical protein
MGDRTKGIPTSETLRALGDEAEQLTGTIETLKTKTKEITDLLEAFSAVVDQTERSISKIKGTRETSHLELLRGVAAGALLIGAPLYACGWAYLYRYYKSFGLSLSDLDLPTYQTMVYSVPGIPLMMTWDVWLPALIVLIAILLLVCNRRIPIVKRTSVGAQMGIFLEAVAQLGTSL